MSLPQIKFFNSSLIKFCKQIKSFLKYSLNIGQGDKLQEVSLKHDDYFLVSLRTMKFSQWKKIDRIREELTWNLLNSFQELRKK